MNAVVTIFPSTDFEYTYGEVYEFARAQNRLVYLVHDLHGFDCGESDSGIGTHHDFRFRDAICNALSNIGRAYELSRVVRQR